MTVQDHAGVTLRSEHAGDSARALRSSALARLLAALALLAPVAASAATTASLYPTTWVAGNAWTSPTNAYSVNTTYATAAPAKNGTVSGHWGGFDFSAVPAGSTGISVAITCVYNVSTNASAATLSFQPSSGGAAIGTAAQDTAEPTVDTPVSASFGVTEAQLRAADFEVSVDAARGASNTAVTFSLDAVSLVVTYTPPVAPGAPGTPSFSSIAQNTLTVSWTAPASGGAVAGYRVFRAPDNGSNAPGTFAQLGADLGSSTLTYPDSGLTANTKYWYYVQAFNAGGTASSANASVTTLPSAPGAPGNPTYAAVTQTTLTVSWTAPASGGAVAGYRVFRAPDNGSNAPGTFAQLGADLGSSTLSFPDSGLTANTRYWYYVQAFNAGGTGDSGNTSVTTLQVAAPGAPGNPTYAAVTQTTLTVSWAAPASGGAVAGYRVFRAPDNGSNAPGTFAQLGTDLGSATLTYPDSGLTANTKYWYYVQAFNAGGTGSSGNTSITTLQIPAPGAPGNPTYANVAQNTLTVSWTAPASGGAVAGYRVFRAPDNGSNAPGTFAQVGTDLGSGTLSYPDSGLGANTKYWYYVQAFNAGGTGSSGNTSVTTLQVPAPGAPGNPTYSAVAQSTLTVSWTAPGSGGAVAGYRVFRAPDNGSDAPGTFAQVGTDLGSATLTYPDSGLIANTKYWYYVQAFNAGGTGSSGNTSVTTAAVIATGTTVGDAGNPPSGTIAPGSAARAVDAFTLQTSTGTDAVSSATVSLASGTWVGIAAVSIQDTSACTQGTPFGSIAPASNQVVIPLTGVTASGTAATYYVCVTPKAHSAMPVPPGAEYAVTATVTAIASTNPKTYADTASATITIDNKSPANVVWGAITPAAGKVTLSWTPPADADFSTVVVLRNSGAPVVDAPPEGTTPGVGTNLPNSVVVCAQAAGPCEDSPLSDGSAYYYKAFARDLYGNYAVGLAAGPVFPGTNPFPVGSGDPARPMVAIVNPGNGAVVSGGLTQAFRVQVRVWSPSLAISGVRVTPDAGASWTTLTQSTLYAGTPDLSGVWEGQLTLAEGSYLLVAQAKNDAATWINSVPVGVVVKAATTGDGRLLVRDNSSQLCSDCHTHKAHSSETMGTTYGSWATVCRDCHTPHGTTNIYLVPTQITPPPLGAAVPTPKNVVFTDPTVLENGDKTGACQVCHTQTDYYRADGTSPGGSHYTGDCGTCHKHADGLKASCTDCHGTKDRAASVSGADSNIASAPPDLAHDPADPLKTPTATGAVPNGVHLAHLDKIDFRAAPLQCAACHLTNQHKDGNADVAWGEVATGKGAFSPTPATGPVGAGFSTTPTCTTWCHGNGLAGGGRGLTWSWNGTGPLACNSCHGQSSVAMPAQAAAHHPQNATCASCHGVDYTTGPKTNHIDGTVQHPTGCRACHGKLVGLGGAVATNTDAAAAPGFDGTAVDTKGNVARTAVGVGAHGTHVSGGTMMSPKCGECHQIPANDDVAHANGAYAWSWTAIEGVTPSYTAPSCTNYCHSNARPLGQASATPVPMAWTSTTALGCADCHKTSAGGATDLSPRHGKHLTYAFSCDECHATTMADNSSSAIGTRASHVNGTKNVDFSSTALAVQIAQQGGGYAGYTCSSTYCHSDGTSIAAPFGAPVGAALSWLDGTTSAKCDNCHGGNASADFVLATGSHGAHVDQAGYLGTNLGCVTCHANTVSADRTISDAANHVNGLRDVTAPSWAASSCGTNYCHSNGTEALVAADYKPVTWGVTALANDCKGCHGTEAGSIAGAPWYANDTASFKTRNSHQKHVASAGDCVSCHDQTVTSAGALVASGTKHLDASRDVHGAKIGGYDEPSETCSAVVCHGGNDAQWGGTLTCANCHLGTGDLNDWNIANDVTSRIDSNEWSTRGHGQGFAAFSGTTNRCVYCHDDTSTSAKHGQSGNPFRLRGASDASGATVAYDTTSELAVVAVCLDCHAVTGANGVDPDGAGGQPKVGPATARIDAIHHGAKHGATNGGQRCWDCHDAHGDSGNVKMISRDVLANATDVHGLTGTRAAAEAIFTTAAVGGYTDQTAPTYNGICQVCHTATKFWRADGTLPHNETQDCVSCHSHEQPPDLAFQGAGACSACHLAPSAAGNQDLDDYVYNNGTKAMVDGDDWAASGHGATSAYAQSGNPGAAFPVNATVEGCYYCHAPDTAIAGGNGVASAHGDATNPFRLANTGGTDGKNGACLVCHKPGSTGYDPDGTNGTFADGRPASKKVGAAHYGAKHATGGKGGELCWDCHDPHGDYNYTVGNRGLAYMIQERPVRTHVASDPNGWGIPDAATELANAVAFDKAVGGDTAALDGTDYVSAGTPTRGVCQVCHTTTTFWTSSGGGATHENGAARCVSCHDHDQGTVDAFKPVSPTSCSTCHPTPPRGGRHDAHLAAASSTTYGDVTIRSTSTEYDFGCGKCHTTVASNHMDDQGGTAADPYRVDVGFDLGGTYPAPAATVGTESGTGTTPALVFGWQNGTCSATYCHDPLGAAYAVGAGAKVAVSWNTAATLTCTSCHDDAYNLTATLLPGAHGKHSLATANGGYAYGCEKCHANTVTDSATVSNRTFHVNGNKDDVKFNASPANQVAGTFSGGTAGTCSNTYCHSDGKSQTAPFTSGPSAAWNTSAGCGSCHGQGGGTSTTLTASHARHVDTVASDGYGYDCDRCHNNTGNGTTITNKANHVDADATHDVAFNSLPVVQTAGTYDPATKTCASTYCHSNGQSVTAPFTSTSAAWGTTAGCTSCHGGGGAATTTLSARHGLHVNATASGGYAYDCARCHVNTGTASAITNKANHVDGDATTHDVAFSNAPFDQSAGTYNATGQTCSNTYCHSDGQDRTAPFTSGPSISWTTAKTCGSCHAAGSALATRSHGAHVNNAAYTGSFGCATCHDTAQDDSTIAPAKLAQHVNFVVEVLGGYTDGTANGVADGTCSTNACHSNGTEAPLVAADYKSVAWGGTLANDCKGCHGAETTPDFTSQYGEPNYVNNTGSYKSRNSHKAHVSDTLATAKTECVNCHSQTVDATGALVAAKHLDLDGAADVSGAKIGSYTDSTETCNTVTCHGGGSPQWGGTLDCSACHMGGTGTTDAEVDDFNYGNGTLAKLDPEDWINYGHGRPTASGVYDSGNSAAAFDTNIAVSTDDGCKYCHDKNVQHGQFGTSANPFRLANVGAGNTAALKNQVCTTCHGGAGYLGKTATKAIDASHHGAKHTATNGGELCWDCHDPHGDSRYTTNATETPVVAANELLGHMIDAKLVRTHPSAEGNTTEWGTNGTAGPTYATSSPRFNKSLVAPTTSYDWGDYALASPYNGICQVCHTATSRMLASGTTWTNDSAHNTGQNCTTACHTHDQPPADAFKGKGTCTGCHVARTGSIPRAAITGADATTGGNDFIRPSRHVSNGTTTSIVTEFDCIVCHAEGDVTSAGTNIKTVSSLHGGDSQTVKTVDLRDVDSPSGGSVAADWPKTRLGADVRTINTGTDPATNDRDKMDRFCMGCHDSNGATGVAVNATNDGLATSADPAASPVSRARSPFNTVDNQTNATDSAGLNALRQGQGVLNVRDQFNSTNKVGMNWASHHNLNQFTKRYTSRNTTAWPNGAWVNTTTKDGVSLQTAGETAGLHCSDCHLNEANAHGSRNTFFMLGNNAGADVAFTNSMQTNSTDICVKCHAATVYATNASNPTNATLARFSHTACGSVSGASMSYLGSATNGVRCLGCHGGYEFGTIHGTNKTYRPLNNASASSPQYRFMGSGGSWRYYSPNGQTSLTQASWESNTTATCYTISAADNWGGCNKHATGGKTSTLNRGRGLQY